MQSIFIAKVLDAGSIKEFDKPYNLLKSKNNLLYKLVEQTGGAEAQKLFEMARRAYFSKQDNSSKKRKDNKETDADPNVEQSNASNIDIPSIVVHPDTEKELEASPV